MRDVAARLREGTPVTFRPVGHSMTPRIYSRDLVTVNPLGAHVPAVGDIVLATVRGSILLHLVSAIDPKGRVQISNNHGHVNGWTSREKVWGLVTKVERS